MRLQTFLFIILSLISGSTLLAQNTKNDSNWIRTGQFGLSLSQVSLSDWASGGENNVGLEVFVNYSADLKKGKNIWKNRFEFAYGLDKGGDDATEKTNDKLYISSTYGRAINKTLYASVSGDFKTQFTNGYNYKTDPKTTLSKFFSPAYLQIGAGAMWIPKPWITMGFNPASFKATFVLDDDLSNQGAFGVDVDKNGEGDKLFSEFGASMKIEVKKEIIKNINLYSRLELFTSYLEDTKNVDLYWNVQINMTINKWFAANIATNMIADNNVKISKEDGTISTKLQFKEALGIGLVFNF